MNERVHNFSIPKKAFNTLSEAEQNFVFLIGRSLNDITILKKRFEDLVADFDGSATPNYKHRYERAEIVLLLRHLCGVLYELRKIPNNKEFSVIVQETDKKLPDEAIRAKKLINRYFGRKGNLICKIRNHFAFHAIGYQNRRDYDDARSKAIADMDSFDFSVGESRHNQLITFAEKYSTLVIAYAASSTEKPDLGAIFTEMQQIYNNTYLYFSNLLGEFLIFKFPRLRMPTRKV